MATKDRPLRVAIVGTGLAGLSTAYLLSECNASDAAGRPLKVQVHLLDRSDSIGMDTASLSIKSDTDETFRVDVPMRSINGGSHGRVRKLYQHLGVPLVRSDFSYSFSRLAAPSSSSSSSSSSASSSSSSPLQSPPPPSSRPDADASDEEAEQADEPPTPPPAYSEATESSRPPSPAAVSDAASDPKLAIPARPFQTTSLLYQGASGLRWPPLSLPSHLHASSTSLGEKVAYLAETAFLALSYLYLLALAFFYVSLGLSRPTSTTRSRTSFSEQFGIANVAAVPLEEFCEKHRVPRQMVDKVLIPLMAAVATVGVDQARGMPTGEVLDYIVDTFAHSHYVTDPSVGVRGIVRRLVAPVPPAQIHLGIEITRIEALVAQPDAAYRIHYRGRESGTSEPVLRSLEVDHVVFATQADQAARLLSTLGSSSSTTRPATEEAADSLKEEAIKALQAFTYVRTLVVTHRDQSILPAVGQDRRDLNLAVFEQPESFPGGSSSVVEQQHWDESLDYLPPSSVQTTHIISPIRSRRAHHPHPTADSKANARPAAAAAAAAAAPVLQTTNPIVAIDAKHILSSTWFSRAFATAESQAVLGRFLLSSSTPSPSPSSSSTPSSASSPSSLQGRPLGHPTTSSSTTTKTTGGIWFVGSYVATGFPLLEGCVSSAENVVRALVRQERATFDGPWLF